MPFKNTRGVQANSRIIMSNSEIVLGISVFYGFFFQIIKDFSFSKEPLNAPSIFKRHMKTREKRVGKWISV
jgi:hypothetical protein